MFSKAILMLQLACIALGQLAANSIAEVQARALHRTRILASPMQLDLPGASNYRSIVRTARDEWRQHHLSSPVHRNRFAVSAERGEVAQEISQAGPTNSLMDPEVVQDPRHKFLLEAPAIFAPYIGPGYRETKAYTIVPKKMWGFEQSQELASLAVNIRCTVIKLDDSSLWVHAPLFPTEEFLDHLDELGGEVAHIVLPTYALEHKIPMSPFIRCLREKAKQKNGRMPQVWVVPDTWSFPFDLPIRWLGIPVDGVLGQDKPSWAAEIDYKILKIADVGKPFVEAAFFHRSTQTLIVTDTVYQVPRTPPDVVAPELLLDVAPDDPTKPLPDTPKTREQAWAKMALLVAFFIPARQRLVKGGKAEWQEGYMDSFEMISGRLLVSPILQKLVFEKASPIVGKWVEDLAKWPFTQVVPAHYAAPVKATPEDLRQAFGFALEGYTTVLPKEDMQTLNDLGAIVLSLSGKPTDESQAVYSRLFDKFFKNLFLEKTGWLEEKDSTAVGNRAPSERLIETPSAVFISGPIIALIGLGGVVFTVLRLRCGTATVAEKPFLTS
eukprot:gnl/TRDRNA2_/TRDRNA2_58236_c0_seq1.p1 gnl/TRDRNA2_/TRDRNA2_58236_c0~~gnl/TRDRNA2_/TRDRNA2_58236_c0_seq1.p1  ORF type:complete len:553 (-),score=81.07 gnl/TRDRNA2_/TRDRNA2_58236_c0_seq1:60-1718(-)